MADSSRVLVSIHDVTKTYASNGRSVRALSPTQFALEEGETAALVGPSGCGKSTLLLLLAGMERPTTGAIQFKGDPLSRPHREIALVLQNYGLFPWKTVLKNVELGLRIRGENAAEHRVHELLQELGIADKKDCYPQQLSGGQQQRVALARALVLRPSLLLMDEPFAALDTLTRERLQDLVAEAWRRRKFGMVLVTHNIQEAVRLGRSIFMMGGKPGTILARIDNPQACSPNYRGSEGFYDTALTVRRELESAT